MLLANAIPLAWGDPLVCTGALDEPRAVTVNPQPIASSVLARPLNLEPVVADLRVTAG
ncbi:MAG: hypothetical protein M3Y09_14955 [Actinomycetota bacterium]|nr:hypothetical protein [Actinomycetota bacterium]